MWPRIEFDPLKLFNLQIDDLLLQDPYYVRLTIQESYPQLGDDLFIGLLSVPDVVGYFSEVCPHEADRIREGIKRVGPQEDNRILQAQARVLAVSYPWNLGRAKAPEIWDALPWHHWDPSAIYDRVELNDKTVLDIGAGTGQVAIRCAPYARLVLALEPVARLRRYIERKMDAAGFSNVQTISGVLEELPLQDASVDVAILASGSFGWNPKKELVELERVTRPGGTILMLAPCNFEDERILASIRGAGGYAEFNFELPCAGKKPAFINRRD